MRINLSKVIIEQVCPDHQHCITHPNYFFFFNFNFWPQIISMWTHLQPMRFSGDLFIHSGGNYNLIFWPQTPDTHTLATGGMSVVILVIAFLGRWSIGVRCSPTIQDHHPPCRKAYGYFYLSNASSYNILHCLVIDYSLYSTPIGTQIKYSFRLNLAIHAMWVVIR